MLIYPISKITRSSVNSGVLLISARYVPPRNDSVHNWFAGATWTDQRSSRITLKNENIWIILYGISYINTIDHVFIRFHWYLTLQGPLSFPPAHRLSSPIFWAWSPQSSMHSFWPMIGIVTTCNSSGLVTPFWSVFPHPEFSHWTPSKMRFW